MSCRSRISAVELPCPACNVPVTNYTVTVKNGAATGVFRGALTGAGDHGYAGSGVFITSFVHGASLTTERVVPFFAAPRTFVPSPEKLRRSAEPR